MFEYKSGKIAAKLNKSEKLIVEGIEFSIENGKTLALAGKTGAGKTTIASSVMGLVSENINIENSHVIIDGKDLSPEERRKALGKDIVYIPQSGHESLNKTRKIKDQFADSKISLSAAEESLSFVGFKDAARILDMYPFELSGGMAQRVVIALATGADAKLVIADEPTNGIDEEFRKDFLPLMGKAFPKASVLVITHDSDLAKACDGIIELTKPEEKENSPENISIKALRNKTKQSESIILKVSGLSKSYGKSCILNSAELEISEGLFTGLLGESGIGKSTLAKLITGLDVPDGGKIIFSGKSLFDAKGNYDRKTGLAIQMVYQQPYAVLDPSQKIRAGLRELIKYHGLLKQHPDTKTSAEEYIDLMAEKLGLAGDILNHLPTQISGGEAQRAAILKCLLLKPKLLILDEATSMLDEATQVNILTLIKNEMSENGGSVLMISHDEALTKDYCDYVYRLKDGKTVLLGE